MKTDYTKNELTNLVSTFYKGLLTFDKAIALFELEYSFTPTIIKRLDIVSEDYIASMNFPEIASAENLTYMKDLQDSGATNMFAANSFIQAALCCSRKEASELLGIYMKHYEELYYPENNL